MVEPYITLHGNAQEAIDFYEQVFGGTNKRVMLYRDAPIDPEYPTDEFMKNWVLHGEINLCGTNINFADQPLASDPVNCGHAPDVFAPSHFTSLMVRLETVETVKKIYKMLAEGGEVMMEAAPMPYAKLYAWVKDKYHVSWQLICD
jgi:PhnB protein